MEVGVRKASGVTILDLKGALVLGEPVEEVRNSTEELMGTGVKDFALNLAEVTELDSSGLGILLRTHNVVKQSGGHVRLYAAPKRVMQLLKMVRMDTVFDISEDEASALSAF